VRLLDPAGGGVRVAALSKAPPHQCVTDGDQLYTCERPSAGDGPLSIKSVNISRGKLDPAPVEYRDFNGGLQGTQLLCASDGVLYVAAGQGKQSGEGLGFKGDQSWFLLAINTGTHKPIWRRPLPRRPDTSRRLHFLAARADDRYLVLLQETSDGKVKLSVRDTSTGKVRWEQPLAVSEPDDVQGKLAVAYDIVYPPAGALRALQLSDGKELWNFGSGRSRRTGPPAFKTPSVFAVEEGLGVVAVDAVTGELLWEEKGGQGAEADLTAPPVAGHKYVYSKGPGHLRLIDIETGVAGRAYKATADRFFAYEGIPERIIAMGEDFIAGYPFK
jgi:outer membrane protein assembly factor BamB